MSQCCWQCGQTLVKGKCPGHAKSMATAGSGIPAEAVCFFRDGDRWCCVHGDFLNLQQSPAGFGYSFDEALADLKANSAIRLNETKGKGE